MARLASLFYLLIGSATFAADSKLFRIPTNESQIQIFSAIAAHSGGRESPFTFPRPRYFGGMNLRGLRAIGWNLAYFDFSKSDLRGADFTGSDLRLSDFRGADLSESVFVSTLEDGIRFDKNTKLPFSTTDALARGWLKSDPLP